RSATSISRPVPRQRYVLASRTAGCAAIPGLVSVAAQGKTSNYARPSGRNRRASLADASPLFVLYRRQRALVARSSRARRLPIRPSIWSYWQRPLRERMEACVPALAHDLWIVVYYVA